MLKEIDKTYIQRQTDRQQALTNSTLCPDLALVSIKLALYFSANYMYTQDKTCNSKVNYMYMYMHIWCIRKKHKTYYMILEEVT